MAGRLLYVDQILRWADAHYKRTRQWPTMYSGPIRGTVDETWRRVDSALRVGLRGLSGGSSLARLLNEERGVRNSSSLPPLTIVQVLQWADYHHKRSGTWPTSECGPILEAPGETWKAVDHALRLGMRRLPGNSSLSQLLAQKRSVRNIQALPRFSVKQILIWADDHHRRTGAWPTSQSGCIPHAPGETWSVVNAALRSGRRGFPGGSSLARLLARERGVRNPKKPPRLSLSLILRWAEAHYRRTGHWPTRASGPIPDADGETWSMIDRALRYGKRGLSGKTSLFHLLQRRRKKKAGLSSPLGDGLSCLT
jgi:hypothetical protein